MHRKYFLTIFFLISLTGFSFSQDVIITTPPSPDEIEAPEGEYGIATTGWFHDSLSAKDEKEALNKFTEATQKYLEVLKKNSKDKYYQYLRQGRYQLFSTSEDFTYFSNQNERSKKILELDIQTDALGAQYQKASDAEKAKLKDDLKKKLYELFELKESDRKEEYERLREKLDKLKETLNERQKFKDEIVKRKMEELIGESKHIRW